MNTDSDTNKRTVMLISHHAHPQLVTGAEKVLLMFGAACLDMQLHVVWVSPGPGMSFDRSLQMGMESHIISYPLLWSFIFGPDRLGEEIRSLQQQAEGSMLNQFITRFSPNLIVSNSVINGLPILLRKKTRIPVWWYIHETIPMDVRFDPLLSLIHNHPDRILVPSASVAHSIYPPSLQTGSVDLLPYGVFIPPQHHLSHERNLIRQQYGWTENHVVIGWFGSIYQGKGLIELIRACAHHHTGQTSLVLLTAGNIGDPVYFQDCLAEARQLASVEFRYLGVLPTISSVLPAIDLVAVTSLVEEAFPNVALEAMAYGMCIVAYRSGGLQEIVIDGETGVLVPKGETGLLGSVIQRLAGDPAKRTAMGQKGRERAVQQYREELFKQRVQERVAQLLLK